MDETQVDPPEPAKEPAPVPEPEPKPAIHHHRKPIAPDAIHPVNQGIKPTDKSHPDRPPADGGAMPITDKDAPADKQPIAEKDQPIPEPAVAEDPEVG